MTRIAIFESQMPTQPVLDLSSLQQATASLNEAVLIYQQDCHNAIDAKNPIPYETLVNLIHEFENSALPFKVDIVDWHDIDPAFKRQITAFKTQLLP